ncbi:MAG TPA: hypothetical protein VFQ76_00280 [Longimicrobiaceae bacterium]|nr:hypothetical protein [Longimicrobiaceae bacterium]
MSTQAYHISSRRAMHDAELDRRLEDIGWGLFFVLIGGVWLLPQAWVPDGAPLMGIGLLLLALNAFRWLKGIAVHVLSTALGALALAGGVGELLDAELKLFPAFLVVVGACIVLKPLVARLSRRS